MSDTQTVLLMLVVTGLASGWIWYLGDDELERQRWARSDTRRRNQRSNATAEKTGSRCNSAADCGCGDASGNGGTG